MSAPYWTASDKYSEACPLSSLRIGVRFELDCLAVEVDCLTLEVDHLTLVSDCFDSRSFRGSSSIFSMLGRVKQNECWTHPDCDSITIG